VSQAGNAVAATRAGPVGAFLPVNGAASPDRFTLADDFLEGPRRPGTAPNSSTVLGGTPVEPNCADDAGLVEAWNRGDDGAGAELFRRYYGPVARFYRSKVGPHASDLVQRCFLRCLEIRTRIRIREDRSFRCFVFGVARNVLLEHYRRMQAGARVDFTAQTVEDLSPTPTAELAHGEQSQLLLQALRRLPVDQQIVIELYYWEELNAREIADIYETPEPTIRTRLRRAKLRLEAELAGLAQSPQAAEATASSLDVWARRLRAELDRADDR
jgi:RNA polymerase sigma factor (sigma-70 family)